MKKRKISAIVSLGAIPYDILVCLGVSDTEFKRTITKHGLKWKKYMSLNGRLGKVFQFETRQTVLRMPKVPERCSEYGTLAHEIFHAVDFILRKNMSMKLSWDSDEAYAYLIGYVTEEIFKLINKGL